MERYIKKEEEGSYFLLPFEVMEGVERIEISYEYPRFSTEHREDGSTITKEINIIDFGLNGSGGGYIGSSGSDRSTIYITSGKSSQGFAPTTTSAGQWSIIVGAYKIQESGVKVIYHITFTHKERRLLKGDTHMHTLGSDGVYSVQEVAQLGKKQGLDYIIVTDHNNYTHNFQQVEEEGITVIPGTEWTHYKGHAGLLGVKKPFESAFCVNSLEEAQTKLAEAQKNGALLVLNHPFDHNCGWKWGMENFNYDAVEIWNSGLMVPSNLQCLAWWNEQLQLGRKIPVIGGSDFHRLDVASLVGMPTTCVYAMSNTKGDILHAIRNGNSYISMFTKGPDLFAEAQGKILGETAVTGSELKVHFWNLQERDTVYLITDQGSEEIVCGEGVRDLELKRTPEQAKFCRFEVQRSLVSGLPQMKILVSNPIYFAS
jgi:hypothetical protein